MDDDQPRCSFWDSPTNGDFVLPLRIEPPPDLSDLKPPTTGEPDPSPIAPTPPATKVLPFSHGGRPGAIRKAARPRPITLPSLQQSPLPKDRQGRPSAFGQHHFAIPYLVMGYLQVLLNAFLIGTIIFLAVQFIRTVKRDVDIKLSHQVTEALAEIAHCRKQYEANRCHPDTRVPAMEQACRAWEAGMNRDPTTIGRAKVSATTFAEILNSFIDPITYKSLVAVCFLRP